MGRLPALRPEVVIVALLVLAVGSAAAQDPATEVKRLRMEKVTLYPCNPDEKKGAPKEAQFAEQQKHVVRTEPEAPPWPILAGPSESGRLTVKVGAEFYCVRAYAVETNMPINAGADCGTMVAAAQPRSGATRGLGNDQKGNDHCRKKK